MADDITRNTVMDEDLTRRVDDINAMPDMPVDATIKPQAASGMTASQDFEADRTMHIDAVQAMADANPAANGDTTLRTIRPDVSAHTNNTAKSDAKVFLIKGDEYEMVKCLSDSSGEAQVFLVSRNDKEYVLKVYYPNFDINRKLLQLVRSFQFEMIVELYDYGKTYVDGKHRYYELMEYLRGGSLRDVQLNGDFNRFRRIALQAAAALAYCHENGVLHKDIKPTNFFFRDENQEQLVLGDFGISALREGNSMTYHTTQARTPIYAAPEMYADVIDGEVEIAPAADFYSLGMTLFATWLGENPMSSNERIMMRQKSEGRLPRLSELPDKVRQLVQGLTSVNQQSRWGYDEVERWFLGEDVPVDTSSPFLRYKSFIVDPDKNIVADNVHELVPLLAEREQLGISYLYNGRLIQWLENSGNNKLSEMLKDIITNKYPVDKKAGFMYSLYTMEPTFPYTDMHGATCDDVHSIAMSLLSNQDEYAVMLRKHNDPLFLWLDTHTKCDIERLRSYFSEADEPHISVLRLVYEIDPDIPFLSRHPSSNIHDIAHSFGYSNPTEEDWRSLCDGRLLSWMYSHEDLMACESLRILTQGQPFSHQLAYKVLYNLDRTAAYDLRDASTPEGIGMLLSNQLMQTEHLTPEEFADQMKDYTDQQGRFYYYAQTHGWYDLMNEATRCFDLTLPENRDRLSAYDLRTAMYRFCRILGATPAYLLPNGTILEDGKNIDLQFNSLIRSELRNGSLSQWMSVFYHEDPSQDFAEDYSYEHELENWILALGRLDSQQTYYKRFTKACEDTKNRVAAVRRQWSRARTRSNFWKYTFFSICAVWILLVLIFGFTEHGRVYIVTHKLISIGLTVGGVSGLIVGVHSYFKGIGPFLSIVLGAVGALTSYLPAMALVWVNDTYPALFQYAVVLLTLLYMLICMLTAFRENKATNSELIKDLLSSDDVKSTLLEPLYYTFKTKSHRYKSTKFSMLDEVSDTVNSMSGESVMHYVMWCIMALMLVLEFILFSPKIADVGLPFSDSANQPVQELNEGLAQ
ncbi:MAG: protein kinase [Prevotella sp.]|nr:protein kinase [Prevotella sp.]